MRTVFLLLIFMLFPFLSFFDENAIGELHRFKPGELVSSDLINENFQRHEDSISGISSFEEILGTWNCQASTSYQYNGCGFQLDQDGLWSSGINEELTFSKNNGKFFITPKNFVFPVYCNGSPKTIAASIKAGVLIFQRSDSDGSWTGHARAIDKEHIAIETRMGSEYVQIFICKKSEMPPVTPETLVAKLNPNKTVSLTWADASDDEDAFIVERASSDAVGDMWNRSGFSSIASLTANATSFVDSSVIIGHIYWYRVFSIKNGGRSAGSNVESVNVQ